MKKIPLFIFLTFILTTNFAFCLAKQGNQIKNVGIAKYAVLETTTGNVPLRQKPDENAKRMTHLFKDTVIFADKENQDYYRVELENNNHLWVNKKHIEVQGIIPEKRFEDITKISFKEDKKRYYIKIESNTKSAYQWIENQEGLNFTLYDNYFDPEILKINNKNFITTPKIDNKFRFQYTTEKPLFGYSIDEIEDNKGYNLTIKKAPKINKKKPLKHLITVVDPGHGGDEKGACAYEFVEKTLNLQISKKLRRELRKRGSKVYLTRTKDKKVPLYSRVQFAKEKQADILLSIHQNSLPNRKDVDKRHGVGVYYYNNQSKNLGYYILNSLVKDTKLRDDKLNFASFALTRPTDQLSVLIECGYIIKRDEAQKLANKKFQKIIAKAITKGMEEYFRDFF